MKTPKKPPIKKIDPLEEVINVMLKSQAQTCARAKKLLDERTKTEEQK